MNKVIDDLTKFLLYIQCVERNRQLVRDLAHIERVGSRAASSLMVRVAANRQRFGLRPPAGVATSSSPIVF